MTRILIIAAATAFLAGAAQAQPGGREAPNPDTDKDGKVTLAEFRASQSERQSRMFARMDGDRDGKITQAEMEAARKRAEASGRGPGGPGGGGMFLARMDANKDGSVTKAEMSAMSEQRFRMADTNKDGWLSKGELLMMRQRMRGGPGPE
ncbi:MAG: EF-hand domain-containing protein [Phenylobacterium sp.]|uniref:EF-hand domain-containing protein n=1 Tax=Phenylobacterium sp. TaxID=1871053 RepID=UPI001A5F8123|nr:EF-hand domain-containing protein [Phenylobacterium sp.]MBL8773632.1 EF-hand domain-containing protein [Phenylobacterium sp.]